MSYLLHYHKLSPGKYALTQYPFETRSKLLFQTVTLLARHADYAKTQYKILRMKERMFALNIFPTKVSKKSKRFFI